jgi:hypothetical protein
MGDGKCFAEALGFAWTAFLAGACFATFPALEGAFFATLGAAFAALGGFLATSLVLEGPAAFLARVFWGFLDLEGWESVRAMGLSLQVAALREAQTIPKSAPCGKTEEAPSD